MEYLTDSRDSIPFLKLVIMQRKQKQVKANTTATWHYQRLIFWRHNLFRANNSRIIIGVKPSQFESIAESRA